MNENSLSMLDVSVKKNGRKIKDVARNKIIDIVIISMQGRIFEKIIPKGHIFIDCEWSVTADLIEVHR